MKLTLVHGFTDGNERELIKSASIATKRDQRVSIDLIKARLPPFGTHHTKMMFLVYGDRGMRVCIHTSNLIEQDWHQKTQGFGSHFFFTTQFIFRQFFKSGVCFARIWLSELFQRRNEELDENGDSKTKFKYQLIEYLKSYENSKLNQWIKLIEEHDMSTAK